MSRTMKTAGPDRERDATIIAYFVALMHSRREGDYLQAADAHRQLERFGVQIKFPRKRKACSE